jgi:hypothetical protein
VAGREDLAEALAFFEKEKLQWKVCELVEYGGWMIARSHRGKVIPLPRCQQER